MFQRRLFNLLRINTGYERSDSKDKPLDWFHLDSQRSLCEPDIWLVILFLHESISILKKKQYEGILSHFRIEKYRAYSDTHFFFFFNWDFFLIKCHCITTSISCYSLTISCLPFAENLALGKIASQSSIDVHYGNQLKASFAVDGNHDTAITREHGVCAHTNSDLNAWWRVDLGDSHPVSKVYVLNRGDCCGERLNGFEIRVGTLMAILRRPKRVGYVIYKNLYENLTRFRELLENGRKQSTKMSYLIVFVLYLWTVKIYKSFETPQKHPELIRTHRQWGK